METEIFDETRALGEIAKLPIFKNNLHFFVQPV